MLTLREALQLPCFEKARVIAGERGLDREIRRVHLVDIPDATYSWGRDALLLTAGYGLTDSVERQAALIPTLIEHGLVGLVFSIGWYFASVPDIICAAAEAQGFPVIIVPPDVEFITITERLYVEIVNHEFALKERADGIHRQLTRLVLEGGDLSALTETLARILERSVLIENVASEVLATAQHGPVDEARLRAIEAGRTPPERAQRLLKRGIYAELQQKLSPVRFSVMPDLGMTMERVVAPIVAGQDIYGYIWVVAGDHPLTDLDTLAIEHAATVAALVLLREQAVRDAQQALRGDFLAHLLRQEAQAKPDGALVERGRAIGYQFDQPHQVLFVMSRSLAGGTLAQLGVRIDNWLHRQGEWGLVVSREPGLAIIIEARTAAIGQRLAERLVTEVGTPAQPLMIGVSTVRLADKSLGRPYAEAVEAAEIGQRLQLDPPIVSFESLGLLDWLYRLPAEALRHNPYWMKVETLAEHDHKTNGDLLHTLEAYLDYGGALAEAAGAINVHRNTLLYRLGRIEEIIGIDLKEVEQRLNLHVALKGFRLKR